MSTEINETRTDQDSEHESPEQFEQAEQSWAADASGTAPQEPAAERDDSDSESDSEDERDEDEAYPGETRFGRDGSAPAYATSADAEAEQDGDAEAQAVDDGFPAFDELPRSETSMPETEQPLASDDAVDADDDLALSTDPESVETPAGSADSVEPEGVPMPENLGGHNLDAEGRPLVGADTQQEFLSRWTQIQISFLEDPAGAVESADTLIREIGTAILASIENRGGELAAEGRAAADTEQQRLALRQYRAYIGVLLPQ